MVEAGERMRGRHKAEDLGWGITVEELKWLDSGQILKVELTGFMDELPMS
jgi:hypothetical protein